MHERLKRTIYYSTPITSVVLFFLIISSHFFLPVIYRENQIWKNYYTLLVEEAAPVSEIASLLRENGYTELIHKNNTMVSFFSFHSEEQIKLSALSSRLDILDPRYDDYMKRLENYFHTIGNNAAYTIYYIKDNRSPILFYSSIRPIMVNTPYTWRIAEINIFSHMLVLFLFSCIIGLTLFYKKTYRSFIIAAGFPWLFGLVHSGFTIFTGSTLLYLAFTLLATDLFAVIKYYLNYRSIDFSKANLPQKLSLFGLALFASLFFAVFPEVHLSRWIPLVLSLLADCFLFLIFVFFMFQKRRKQEHRLFFSISIQPSKVGITFATTRFSLLSVIIVVIFFAPLVYRLSGKGDHIRIPVPKMVERTDQITWHDIEKLGLYRENSLPNLFDFLSHRAYQSGFFYKRLYHFPSKGEKITISFYSKENGRIVKKERVIKVFSESWFQEVLNQAKDEGITKLLIDQGSAVTVSMEASKPMAFINTAFVLRNGIISFIVFLPLVLINYHLTVENKYGMKSFILRRKSQAA